MKTSTNRRSSRRAAVAIAAAAALIGLTACGDTEATTSPEAQSTQGDGSGEGVAAAQALYEKYRTRPTEIPNQTPIDKPIPEGKSITFISCGTATCDLEAAIIKQATDKLGWSLTTIASDGTPEKVKAAWQQILREKPDGVIYPATPRAAFEQELQQAEQMGIQVTACCTTDPAENGIDFVIGTPEQSKPVGEAMAAWVINESGGSAKSVYVDLSAFPILASLYEGYTGVMDDLCEDCTYDRLDIPVTALGKDVPTRIVSYLRANPDVKYVALSVDGALGVGLPAALKAAGLNDIKVIGEGPDETTLQYISSGQQEATVTFPYYEEMFSLVDAHARMFAGVPLESDIEIPTWIVTKENLPTDEEIFPVVEDAVQQYFELWGVA